MLALGCLAEAEDAPPYNPCAYGQAQAADGGCVRSAARAAPRRRTALPARARLEAARDLRMYAGSVGGLRRIERVQRISSVHARWDLRTVRMWRRHRRSRGSGSGGTASAAPVRQKNCGQFKVRAQCQGCFARLLHVRADLRLEPAVSSVRLVRERLRADRYSNRQIACTEQYYAGYQDYANIVTCMQQFCPQCVQWASAAEGRSRAWRPRGVRSSICVPSSTTRSGGIRKNAWRAARCATGTRTAARARAPSRGARSRAPSRGPGRTWCARAM